MTDIVINKSKLETKKISIADAKIGQWYRIVEYLHNVYLVGEIGVIASTYNAEVRRALYSPTGGAYSHEDIVLEEISKVEIICS